MQERLQDHMGECFEQLASSAGLRAGFGQQLDELEKYRLKTSD